MKQLSFNEIVEEARRPEWPECFKSCKNFSNDFGDGKKDYFMDWYRNKPDMSKPRCVVGLREGNWKNKLIDNVWHSYMKCYEAMEE